MNKCRTYFAIKGDFNPSEISELLGLEPYKTAEKGKLRPNGKGRCEFSRWEFGLCEEYDPDISAMVEKTVASLLEKTEILRHIKETYDVDMYVEIVPQIHIDEVTPCLGSNLKIIDFCHAARAEIDIDMYLYDCDESAE